MLGALGWVRSGPAFQGSVPGLLCPGPAGPPPRPTLWMCCLPTGCVLTLKTFSCPLFSPPPQTGKFPGASDFRLAPSNPDVQLLVCAAVVWTWLGRLRAILHRRVRAQEILRPPHLLWAKSFPCDRVRLGKQSPNISAGKCAPGAITSRVCNCLLTANIHDFPYPQWNVPPPFSVIRQ